MILPRLIPSPSASPPGERSLDDQQKAIVARDRGGYKHKSKKILRGLQNLQIMILHYHLMSRSISMISNALRCRENLLLFAQTVYDNDILFALIW